MRRSSTRIADWCVAWSVGSASQEECDELGMVDAQRLACSSGRRRARCHARRRRQRRQMGLRVTDRAAGRDAGQGRPRLSQRGGCQHPRQGRPRPRDAGARRELPELVVRHQQGVSLPGPQVRPAGLRPVGDPSSDLGVHGQLTCRGRDVHVRFGPNNRRCSDGGTSGPSETGVSEGFDIGISEVSEQEGTPCQTTPRSLRTLYASMVISRRTRSSTSSPTGRNSISDCSRFVTDRSTMDLHVNERDTPSQHITLDVQIGGFKPFVAKSSASSLSTVSTRSVTR